MRMEGEREGHCLMPHAKDRIEGCHREESEAANHFQGHAAGIQ